VLVVSHVPAPPCVVPSPLQKRTAACDDT
jgi:hypothetical protein